MAVYNMKKIRSQGFSLFELLIVIAIMGILISVAVVSYSTIQKKSRDSRRKSDMKSIQNAFEQYYAESNSSYLSDEASCRAISTAYLPAGFPSDPDPNSAFPIYLVSCSTTDYCVCALLDAAGMGNSNENCNFQAATKDYYCVKSLQ